jgi:hypothetical protein
MGLAPRTRERTGTSVRECRGRLAADERRRLADEILVLEGVHHEQREIYAAREVALEDRVAHVAAPHGQAMTLALFKVAPSHDGPLRVACKHPLACLHLVVEVRVANESCKRSDDFQEQPELPRVHVLTIACDVPPDE